MIPEFYNKLEYVLRDLKWVSRALDTGPLKEDLSQLKIIAAVVDELAFEVKQLDPTFDINNCQNGV